MSVTPGFRKIKTSTEKYLTLLTQTGIITAMPASGALNQTWDFQPSKNDWTIRNVGYAMNSYAHSNGQIAAPVTGNTLDTKWDIIFHDGVYSIRVVSVSDPPIAWSIGLNDQLSLDANQPINPMQQFNIDPTFE